MRNALRSIKIRITFVTVCFSLIAITSLAVFSLYYFQQVIRTNLLQSIEFNLHLVADLINRDIEYLDRLRILAHSRPETMRFLQDDQLSAGLTWQLHTGLLEDAMGNSVAYSDLFLRRLVVVDKNLERRVQIGFFTDAVPFFSHKIHLLGDFCTESESSWRQIKQDPFSAAFAEPTLYRITPILIQGEIIGYTYFSISTNVFLRPLSGYHFAYEGSLFVTVRDSVYAVENGQITKSPIEFSDSNRLNFTPLNEATEVFTFEGANGRHFAVSSPLGDSGINLIQTFPAEIIIQETYFVISAVLLIGLGILIFGFWVAWYLSHIINSPIKKIRKQLKTIAAGNFDTNTDIEWKNEFGEIGRGINQLAKDVDEHIKSRIETEKRKQDLEYKMLQNQINPHFLYNTLGTIKWMATIQKADGIAEITVSLSRLLKSIAKINSAIVPLSHEISLLADYFVIANYRYGGSITSKIDVPEEFLDTGIPVFSLQPIVENAIFHGIEAKGGVGFVHVNAYAANGDLEIAIKDNGVGMSDKALEDILAEDSADNPGLFRKVGISNVHNRIRHEFGESYGITINSVKGEFTTVVLKLPIQKVGEGLDKAADC